ncbi:hypothetical protein B0T16DRAFT_415982 [Cercophora newfieldiana]|uniref:Uncharacterized protein n=1 Tax=Cercophora newfieldiana TaxID=92897 RepID=A0AA40CNH7_9PEZI|nr:hypothetical protein B0T16DRAFT_415982 [Cercophora newfieldiana]
MRSIRDVAVFAWAVVGINGNLASFSHGRPGRGAQPLEGLPVWDPTAASTLYQGPENQAMTRNFLTADRYPPTPEGSAFGYDVPDAAPLRPVVQGYNSTTALSDFARERHVHTPNLPLQAASPGHPDGRRFGHPQASFVRDEEQPRRNIPPRGAGCDCMLRQQYIEPTATGVHTRDCAGAPTTQEYRYNSRDIRRQQH